MIKIELAKPQQESAMTMSVESALKQRETKREYLDTPLSLTKLSQILFAAQGLRGNGNKLTAPSAQEQYPISTYVVVNNVVAKKNSPLAPGLYQYDNSDHSLVELQTGLFSKQLEEAAIGEQAWVGNAAVIVILAGNIQSMNQHFSEQPPFNKRGERYNYIEVGAIAQNMQLQGTTLDVGMVLVGGFNNQEVKTILSLANDLEPSALVCMGNV